VAAPPSGPTGVNFHRRAACNARFPKNLLDSRDSFFTSTTLPLASTSARIRTVTFPRIVLRAFAGTSGKTSFTTARGTGFWRAGASTADLTGTATGCSGAELLRKKRGKIAADATNNPMAPATRRFRGVALFVLDGGG